MRDHVDPTSTEAVAALPAALPLLNRAWLTRTVLGVLFVLVCVRAWVFVVHPQVHFDSDQAVIGLMARDLAAGREFPWFTYGRIYMLAISAWFSAPLFALFGSSVLLLKLPLVGLNIAALALVWIGLRQERGATPITTALSVLPFAVPSVVASSRLVEQGGGNIEPLVLLVLAFLVRTRPLVLGPVLGVAYLNREFALLSVVALLLMELLQGRLLKRWRSQLIMLASMAAVVMLGKYIATLAANYYGGGPNIGSPDIRNVASLFELHLPALLGVNKAPFHAYNLTSNLRVNHARLAPVVVGWALFALFALRKTRWLELDGMATYLILLGLGQATSYILFCPLSDDRMLIRYTLLILLGFVGLLSFALRNPLARIPSAALVLVLTVLNGRDHVRLIREYATHPAENAHQQLADALVQRGIHYALANYWVSYHVSFLSQERVLVESDSDQRIDRYRVAIEQHADEVYRIRAKKCPGGEQVANWYVCPPKRPKH